MQKILKCTCEHEFQDAQYGKSRRVCILQDGVTTGVFECTVCGKAHYPSLRGGVAKAIERKRRKR